MVLQTLLETIEQPAFGDIIHSYHTRNNTWHDSWDNPGEHTGCFTQQHSNTEEHSAKKDGDTGLCRRATW